MKPAQREDIEIIYNTYKSRYKLSLNAQQKEKFFELIDGYVQYLQLGLIALSEQKNNTSVENMLSLYTSDERVQLQSEELWESLLPPEQELLLQVVSGKKVTKNEETAYVFETGFLRPENNVYTIFSPIFEEYVRRLQKSPQQANGELTKKEDALFNFLKKHVNTLCEREAIIEAVWPEVGELGVSDWAVDRLISRLRGKLKKQESAHEIQTVKTRGFKLIKG